jgi:sodium transport system permease protein
MRSGNIGVVYRKELVDMIRDRRTVISAVVIPLLIFPLLVIGFGSAVAKSVKKVRQERQEIGVIGASNAPALFALLAAHPNLQVTTNVLDYTNAISNKKIRAAVALPDSLEKALAPGQGKPTIRIFNYSGEVRSQFAVRTIQEALRNYSDDLAAQRLKEKGLTKDDIKPFEVAETNVAPPEKVGGNILGGLIPYMIIVLSFGGAMAPAIDLTAGEKERGTIETVLASPISRVDLVVGKFFMVLTASTATTLISLFSFAITFNLPKFVLQGGGAPPFPFQLSLSSVLGVVALMLPLEVMFSAGLMALALFAKSYKEAQTYISPLLVVVIMPAMIALLPGFDLKPSLAVIPIVNVTLLSKELLSGTWHLGLAGAVFASSCFYAGLALAAAVSMFKKESVLFRS